MRTPTFEKKSQTQFFSASFRLFCRKLCHTDVDSREQQAILLKKWKISGKKCVYVFPVFTAKKLARFCHAVLDFREHQGLPPD